jgi:pyridoxal phosphate enzyme (YggS family)
VASTIAVAPAGAAVAANLDAVRARLAAACAEAGRPAESVTLIAVSKTVGPAPIEEAIAHGQRSFGENRVQELGHKWPPLRARHPGLALHLIGALQTNKVRDALAQADFIHSLDRQRLAEAIAAERDRGARCPQLFVQVNTGEEAQKAGIAPRAADDFVEDCRTRLALPVIGLMCIPPLEDEPAPHFALLREIARRHGLAALSMGMTADFEIAIAFGATHVRVGTAIFGSRPPVPQ